MSFNWNSNLKYLKPPEAELFWKDCLYYYPRSSWISCAVHLFQLSLVEEGLLRLEIKFVSTTVEELLLSACQRHCFKTKPTHRELKYFCPKLSCLAEEWPQPSPALNHCWEPTCSKYTEVGFSARNCLSFRVSWMAKRVQPWHC